MARMNTNRTLTFDSGAVQFAKRYRVSRLQMVQAEILHGVIRAVHFTLVVQVRIDTCALNSVGVASTFLISILCTQVNLSTLVFGLYFC